MFVKTYLRQSILALAAAGLGLAAQAQTTNLSFDNLSGNLGNAAATYGVELQHSMAPLFLLTGSSFVSGYSQGKLLGYYGLTDTFLSIAMPAGSTSTFSVNSLDLSGLVYSNFYFLPNQSGSISITGMRTDGTTVTANNFVVTGGQLTSYGSASFAGFTGLTSVRLGGIAGSLPVYIGVDNINITVTPVPEPETITLLVAGLGLVGLATRRRKQAGKL